MTDKEIEAEAKKAGGRLEGSRWVFEDDDLHQFARALLASEKERCAKKAERWCRDELIEIHDICSGLSSVLRA